MDHDVVVEYIYVIFLRRKEMVEKTIIFLRKVSFFFHPRAQPNATRVYGICVDHGSDANVGVEFLHYFQIYTEWGNHYLEKGRFKRLIQNLQTDLMDGVLLADLVEAVCKYPTLTSTPEPAYSKRAVLVSPREPPI